MEEQIINNEVQQEVQPVPQEETKEHEHMRTRDKSNVIAWGLGVLIIVGSVFKWTGFFNNATIAEICTVGATVWSLCCAPISLNVTLEKFLNRVN